MEEHKEEIEKAMGITGGEYAQPPPHPNIFST
jgi:hypothetical protein